MHRRSKRDIIIKELEGLGGIEEVEDIEEMNGMGHIEEIGAGEMWSESKQ